MKLPPKLEKKRDESCPNCVIITPEGFIIDEKTNANWKLGFNAACEELLPLIKDAQSELKTCYMVAEQGDPINVDCMLAQDIKELIKSIEKKLGEL